MQICRTRRFIRADWRHLAALAIHACALQSPLAFTSPINGADSESSADQSGISTPIYSNIPAGAASALPMGTDGAPSAEQLLLKFMDEHSATNYPAAAETALRLVQAAPDRPHGHYNLACALARLRRIDEAAAALESAIDSGWRDLRHLSMDPDLAVIRSDAAYSRAVNRLQNLLVQEHIEPAPLRTDGWQAVVADISDKAPAIFKSSHVTEASIALVIDGRIVWTGALIQGTVDDADTAAANAVFRLRTPIELIGLLAGANLQQQGRLALSQIIEQGAELERATRNQQGQGAQRRIDPPAVSIVPIGQRRTEPNGDGKAPALSASIDPQKPTMSVLRLAIEIVANQPFGEYCAVSVLEPLGMRNTSFERNTADAASLITGHTVLGTPLPVAGIDDGPHDATFIYTTAGDLAKLIETLLNSVPSSAGLSSTESNPINLLARVNALGPGGAAMDGGLAIQVRATETGRRVQVFEVTDGVGCLMRWHTRTKSGIVILFNSATGGEAAVRIAHLALGGE